MKGQARIKCAGGGIVVLGGGWRRERGGNIWMTLNIFTVKQAVFCAVEPDGNLGGFFLNRFSRRKWNKPILLLGACLYVVFRQNIWQINKYLTVRNKQRFAWWTQNINLLSSYVSCFLYRAKFKVPIELFIYTVYSLTLVLYYMCCNTVFYFNKLFCSFVMSPAVVGNCVSHYFQAGFLLFSCTMGSAFTIKCFSLFSELILNFRPVSEPFFITVLQRIF